MADTNCYRVWLNRGHLEREPIEFSPRFADSIDAALDRLRAAPALAPPIVRAGDWAELEQRWEEERGA